METLTIQSEDEEQLKAIKTIMKALKVNFKVEKSPYNAEFIAKIEKSKQEIKDGKGVRIKVEDLGNRYFTKGH